MTRLKRQPTWYITQRVGSVAELTPLDIYQQPAAFPEFRHPQCQCSVAAPCSGRFVCSAPDHVGSRIVPWCTGACDEVERELGPDVCDSCWQAYDTLLTELEVFHMRTAKDVLTFLERVEEMRTAQKECNTAGASEHTHLRAANLEKIVDKLLGKLLHVGKDDDPVCAWKWAKDYGRHGALEGVLRYRKSEIMALVGKTVRFGEVLGKHSDVSYTIDFEDFTLLERRPVLVDLATVSGVDPIEQYRCNLEEENA